MSIAITYSSVNGNTKAIAEAIESALTARATIKDIQNGADGCWKDYETPCDQPGCSERPFYCGPHVRYALKADTILIGCWNDNDNVDAAAAAFLKDCSDQRIAIFITSGCCDEKYLATVWQNVATLIPESTEVIGRIAIQGTLTEEARKRCEAANPENKITCGRAQNHPNEADFKAASEWAVALFD